METKHTPGPWFIENDYEIKAEPNKTIATSFPLRTNNEANAKLIADCPTMFVYIAKKAAEGDKEAQEIIKRHA
jgi:hypothetical protein